MIKHAWTTVCSKVIVDKNTNNISIDIAEQIKIESQTTPEQYPIRVPGFHLMIVSLWYRDDSDEERICNSRIKYLGPDGSEMGTLSFDLNLEENSRLRTMVTLSNIPLKGPGWHYFVVEQKIRNKWVEVARIPHEVQIEKMNTRIENSQPK